MVDLIELLAVEGTHTRLLACNSEENQRIDIPITKLPAFTAKNVISQHCMYENK